MRTYWTAAGLYVLLVFIGFFLFLGPYEPHTFESGWQDITLLPPSSIMGTLFGICLVVAGVLVFNKTPCWPVAIISLGMVGISLSIAAGIRLARAIEISDFFGGDAASQKLFSRTSFHRARELPSLFRESPSLISPDRRIELRFNEDTCRYAVCDGISRRKKFELEHDGTVNFRWFPNSKILIYEYRYDQNDPVKIFGVSIETGKTILLGGDLHAPIPDL